MEPQQTTVTIPIEQVELCKPPCHRVRLCGDWHSFDHIRRGQDIVSFKVVNPPSYLSKIYLVICAGRVMTFTRDEFANGQNLFPEGLPVSKVTYQYVDIDFEYDAEYIAENETFEMVDEYNEEIELSDTEEEIYDECEDRYVWGTRVTRNQVPTGNKVRRVITPALVDVPEMLIDVVPATTPFDTTTSLTVWQDLLIKPVFDDEEYFHRLVDKHKLHLPSGEDIKDAYNKGEPFYAKVRNILRFGSGCAGFTYCFN